MAMRNSDRAWKKWGQIDPYFGVLSHDAFRLSNFDETVKAEFLRSGELHIDDVLATIRSQIAPDFQPEVAIDFGCGVGRLVIPLCRVCSKVIGVDVSDAMLEEARRNCHANGVGNATFVSSVNQLPAGSYDFVHSFIVFQHIPVDRGLLILERLLSGLRPGGVMAVHFTVRRLASWPVRVVAWARHNVPFAHEFLQLVKGRSMREPPMQMNSYDLPDILLFLRRNAVDKALLKWTDHDGHLGVIIFAQKNLSA